MTIAVDVETMFDTSKLPTLEHLEHVFKDEEPPLLHWEDRVLEFNMKYWFTRIPSCGTSACAWGFATLLSSGRECTDGPPEFWDVGPKTQLIRTLFLLDRLTYQETRTFFWSITEDGRYFDLRGADLKGVNLRGKYLSGLLLDGANLEQALLDQTKLANSSFRGANLSWASLYYTSLPGADLSNADLTNAMAVHTCFRNAVLTGAKLPRLETCVTKGAVFGSPAPNRPVRETQPVRVSV